MTDSERTALEREAVGEIVAALLAEGWRLDVNDGEETTVENSADRETVLNAMFSTDGDTLICKRSGAEANSISIRTVSFIYGNAPDEVVNDCSVGLNHIIDPILERYEEVV